MLKNIGASKTQHLLTASLLEDCHLSFKPLILLCLSKLKIPGCKNMYSIQEQLNGQFHIPPMAKGRLV